ncbi:MAG: XRE family transcriptional regulator [Pseudomonadota bacterium]
MSNKPKRFLRPSNFGGLAPGAEAVNLSEVIDPDPRVGREIRDLRKARGATLTDLSNETALSPGYLSQIENGKAVPSVKALHTISQALGVTISWFFSPQSGDSETLRDFVVRASNRRRLEFKNGIVDELLSPNLSRKLEMLKCTFPPGTSSGREPYQHEGEEAGLVISGTLDLWIGDTHVELSAGDSFAFESHLPHRYENRSDQDTIVVWSITPPSY